MPETAPIGSVTNPGADRATLIDLTTKECAELSECVWFDGLTSNQPCHAQADPEQCNCRLAARGLLNRLRVVQ